MVERVMPLGIYKPGQGRWARGVAAAALGALGIWAGLQTYDWMERKFTHAGAYYVGYWVPGLLLLAFLLAAFYVANRPKATDFLIETETEMKKVTWPTYREVLAATAVVIVVVIILGAFLFSVDRWVIEPIFKLIGLLPGTTTG